MLEFDTKGLELADLIGIPYKENGRALSGLDCYGLSIAAVQILTGKTLRDVVYNNHNETLSDELAPTLNVKPTDKKELGNLIEMTFNKEIHIGVLINKREIIHATYNQGVRISSVNALNIKRIYEVL